MASSDNLTNLVDTWTLQAVMSSRWLTSLYPRLGDARQATLSIQAGASAAERMNRLGLQGRVAPLLERFTLDHPDETEAEEAAWLALIEAQTGLAAFYAILEQAETKPTPGLRGTRTATFTALRKAIRGYRTAFPEPMVERGVAEATSRAVKTCVDAFMERVEEEDAEQQEQLRAATEACVTEALERSIGSEGYWQ